MIFWKKATYSTPLHYRDENLPVLHMEKSQQR